MDPGGLQGGKGRGWGSEGGGGAGMSTHKVMLFWGRMLKMASPAAQNGRLRGGPFLHPSMSIPKSLHQPWDGDVPQVQILVWDLLTGWGRQNPALNVVIWGQDSRVEKLKRWVPRSRDAAASPLAAPADGEGLLLPLPACTCLYLPVSPAWPL